MAYRFVGIFSRATVIPPKAPGPPFVWRQITEPFHGIGACNLDWQTGDRPLDAEVRALVSHLGLDAYDWIYLDYTTWAGPIEFVRAFGQSSGQPFGPIEGDDAKATDAFVTAMAHFGIPRETALRFKPFERGYWGESA